MKTVSDDLFQLIKSLNKPEKRYFKLYASRHVIGTENKYLQLFKAIDKQELYDEVKIKKKFTGEAFTKQLHVTKNYLYSLILNSLRQFHEVKNADKFPLLLRNSQLLFDKGLYKQSEKTLQKAKKIAVENEHYLNLLEVYRMEHLIIHNSTNFKRLEEYVNVGVRSELEALDIYKNFLEFQLLNDQLFIPYWKKGSIRKKEDKEALRQLFEEELYRSAKNAKSYLAKFLYHNARFTYHNLAGEFDKCYEHILNQVRLYEELEDRLKKGKRANRYRSSLNNLFIIQKQLGKYGEAIQTIRKLRAIPSNSMARKAKIVSSSYNLEIDLYLSLGQFKEGIANLVELEADFKKYFDYVDNQQRLGLYFNLAYLYFGADKYNQALDWINFLLNDPDLQRREDIHSFGRLINLVIHYELGNDTLLEYIVKSTYRFLSKRKRLFKVESIILRFLKKYPNWIGNREILQGFRELHQELLQLTDDEYEKQAFEYFDFVSWLESKIQQDSFEEVVKRKKFVEVV